MRKQCVFLALAYVLLFPFGSLFVGAVPSAPVVATNGFYVNDYASVLFDTHRDDMLALSQELNRQTGVQIVLLTVESLQGMDMDTYAEAVILDWEIGGRHGENGVLILTCTGDHSAGIYVGENLAYLDNYRSAKFDTGGDSLSRAIMGIYRPMVQAVYEHSGIQPDQTTLEMLENPKDESSGPFSTGTIIFLAVVLLAMGRSVRVSRKYRDRYLKGNVRQLKTHTRSYDEEEQYKGDRYKIDYDDRD